MRRAVDRPKYINLPVIAEQAAVTERVIRPVKTGETVEKVRKHLLSSEFEDVVKPIFEDRVIDVPTGEISSYVADYVGLCGSMNKIMNDLDADGYEVVQVTPITIAGHGHDVHSTGHTDWGYSFTKGAIITAKRRG
ncbi:hypothetical protein UAJ10_23565 [Nitrospirillum sp. BR 11164]|uniref:hypothetical protein n=1 Tax=Nitrospirillum sp. BR 11164 TaxID=3104324 RepID=UPI002B003270|nr:hypothetical protein [Nitrospirillum sp. BR 11164]MEA1651978.1 hypothetical protein [Nitrospirillum sp. BR 11164]